MSPKTQPNLNTNPTTINSWSALV